MQREKNYEERIEEIVEKANKNAYKPDGMYTLGKESESDLQKIYKTVGIKVEKGYDPEKSKRDYLSDQDITDAFYKHRKDRQYEM